jgi:peptidoglycan/xylan/chitin deacetylase (PgdA/CDA1 family)
MSIRKWKRIITLTVILIILSLFAATIFTGVRYHRLSRQYEALQGSGTLIDLTEYGNIDTEEIESLLHYLGTVDTHSTLEYQTKYPDLYVENDFIFEEDTDEKVCYLTFDDGPNPDITASILDTLKKYDAKATFFVVYRDSKEDRALYRRIVEEGHTIGIHSASHKYNKIYKSVDAYLDDFDRISRQIEESTGVKPEIFRFPGGSVNEYNKQIYQELIAEMIRRGYTYYDWNVSSGDAGGSGVTASAIVDNCLNSGTSSNKKIVLMHDGSGHKNTVAALPRVIKGLEEQGYALKALNKEVSPVTFGY